MRLASIKQKLSIMLAKILKYLCVCNFALFEATEGQTVTYLMNFQGINRVARRSLLLHRLATVEQPGWVPRLPPRIIHQCPPRIIQQGSLQGAAQVHQGGLEGGPARAKVGWDAQRCQDAGLVQPGPAQFGLVWFLVQFGLVWSPVQSSPIQSNSVEFRF